MFLLTHVQRTRNVHSTRTSYVGRNEETTAPSATPDLFWKEHHDHPY